MLKVFARPLFYFAFVSKKSNYRLTFIIPRGLAWSRKHCNFTQQFWII